MELSRVLANHDDATGEPLQQAAALDNFNAAAKKVRQALVQLDASHDTEACMKAIRLSVSETHKIYDDICASLKVKDAWVTHPTLEGLNQEEKKASMKEAAEAAKIQVDTSLRDADALAKETRTWMQSLFENTNRNADFVADKARAVQARNASMELLKSIELVLIKTNLR